LHLSDWDDGGGHPLVVHREGQHARVDGRGDEGGHPSQGQQHEGQHRLPPVDSHAGRRRAILSRGKSVLLQFFLLKKKWISVGPRGRSVLQ